MRLRNTKAAGRVWRTDSWACSHSVQVASLSLLSYDGGAAHLACRNPNECHPCCLSLWVESTSSAASEAKPRVCGEVCLAALLTTSRPSVVSSRKAQSVYALSQRTICFCIAQPMFVCVSICLRECVSICFNIQHLNIKMAKHQSTQCFLPSSRSSLKSVKTINIHYLGFRERPQRAFDNYSAVILPWWA